ncbi:ribokinase [Olsenella sp. KGMB02461]|nr:ribokinase [Olsenella sp. KGMB02461]
MAKLIVCGSVNMDLSIQVDRMPQAGETLTGSGFMTTPGGKGANQAVAASRLGAPVTFIGAVGDDAFGHELRATLEADRIDTCHLSQSTLSTGTAIILRCNAENRIILNPGANGGFGSGFVREALDSLAEPQDMALTQFECAPEAVRTFIRTGHELGLYTMTNPAPAAPMDDEMLSCCDLICLNETECEIVCGILPTSLAQCEAAAAKLHEAGVRQVVITLGERGAYGSARTSDDWLLSPMESAVGATSLDLSTQLVEALPVEAVDTTAAGDTFLGALAAARLEGLSFFDALAFATRASALTVTRLGAQVSIPYREELT